MRDSFITDMKCYETGNAESTYAFNNAWLSCMSAIAAGYYECFLKMEDILKKIDQAGRSRSKICGNLPDAANVGT